MKGRVASRSPGEGARAAYKVEGAGATALDIAVLEHVVAALGGGLELAKAFGVSAPEATDGRFEALGSAKRSSPPRRPEVTGDHGGRLGAKARLEVATGNFKGFKDGLQGETVGPASTRTPSKVWRSLPPAVPARSNTSRHARRARRAAALRRRCPPHDGYVF